MQEYTEGCCVHIFCTWAANHLNLLELSRHHAARWDTYCKTYCVMAGSPYRNFPAEVQLVVRHPQYKHTHQWGPPLLLSPPLLLGPLVFEQRSTGGGAGRLRQVLVAWRHPRNASSDFPPHEYCWKCATARWPHNRFTLTIIYFHSTDKRKLPFNNTVG